MDLSSTFIRRSAGAFCDRVDLTLLSTAKFPFTAAARRWTKDNSSEEEGILQLLASPLHVSQTLWTRKRLCTRRRRWAKEENIVTQDAHSLVFLRTTTQIWTNRC